MTIDFITPAPYSKVQEVKVITDAGEVHSFRFGQDVSKARMIQFIHSELPKSSKRVKRKAAK